MRNENEPKFNQEIVRGFSMGEIAWITIFDDTLLEDPEFLRPFITTNLAPLGKRLNWKDWSEVDYRNLNLYAPQYSSTLKRRHINVFHNCNFHDTMTEQDQHLGYMINYFAGGTGYLQTESSDFYSRFGIQLLILLPLSQWRIFLRRHLMRTIPSIPTIDLLERDIEVSKPN